MSCYICPRCGHCAKCGECTCVVLSGADFIKMKADLRRAEKALAEERRRSDELAEAARAFRGYHDAPYGCARWLDEKLIAVVLARVAKEV